MKYNTLAEVALKFELCEGSSYVRRVVRRRTRCIK